MVEKKWHSSLTDEVYDTKKEAEKAEKKAVKQHFKELHQRAEARKRNRKIVIQIQQLLNSRYF